MSGVDSTSHITLLCSEARTVSAVQLLREAIARHGGYEINTEGDSFHIAFKSVVEAVGFCMDAQYQLLGTPWTRDVLRLPTCRCTTVR